jgi:hypothetical protein
VQCTLSLSKQVGLFPCRGPVAPCRTLPVVSATCHGTVKPGFAGPAISEREAEGASRYIPAEGADRAMLYVGEVAHPIRSRFVFLRDRKDEPILFATRTEQDGPFPRLVKSRFLHSIR